MVVKMKKQEKWALGTVGGFVLTLASMFAYQAAQQEPLKPVDQEETVSQSWSKPSEPVGASLARETAPSEPVKESPSGRWKSQFNDPHNPVMITYESGNTQIQESTRIETIQLRNGGSVLFYHPEALYCADYNKKSLADYCVAMNPEDAHELRLVQFFQNIANWTPGQIAEYIIAMQDDKLLSTAETGRLLCLLRKYDEYSRHQSRDNFTFNPIEYACLDR